MWCRIESTSADVTRLDLACPELIIICCYDISSVNLNDTRGLVRGAADPVSVYEGSALIVRGSAQIRAERDIRTGAAGYAVRRMDPSALVRLSGAGTIWGETGTLGDAGAE